MLPDGKYITTSTLSVQLELPMNHLAILTFLAMFFSSCGLISQPTKEQQDEFEERKAEEIEKRSEPKEAEEETAKKEDETLGGLFSLTGDDALPECNDKRKGLTYFIKAEQTFKYCENSAWVDIDLSGKAGDSGDAEPQGDQGVVGPSGPQGTLGPAGPQGSAGVQGSTGPRPIQIETVSSSG
jgi:hypothetical protein